ncbi:MAG: hypothetical protein ACTSUE_06445 [Promethearchaeota archaeon]
MLTRSSPRLYGRGREPVIIRSPARFELAVTGGSNIYKIPLFHTWTILDIATLLVPSSANRGD